MRYVILQSYPRDPESQKAAVPSTSVYGSLVYRASVAKAILKYGTADQYYFLNLRRLNRPEPGPRAKSIAFDELPTISQDDEAVIFSSSPNLNRLTPVRAAMNRSRTPIAGPIHSMHDVDFMEYLSRIMLDPRIAPYDALLCSSLAGRKVVEGMVEAVAADIEESTGASIEWKPELPVIPIGISTDTQTPAAGEARQRLGIAPDRIVLLYFGRFSTLSKADLAPLILAFAHGILPKHPEAILVLAGDDTAHSQAPTLKRLAEECNCAGSVLIRTNPDPEAKLDLYAAADIFLSPVDSCQETFGISVVEAMSAGLPVVASDWDGYRESIEHNRSGFLVPCAICPWNGLQTAPTLVDASHLWMAATTSVDLRVLVQSISTLIQHPELRKSFGEHGRRIARQRFDWSVVVRSYEELWSNLDRKAKASPLRRAQPSAFDAAFFGRYFQHYGGTLSSSETVSISPLGSKPEHITPVLRSLLSGRMFDPELLSDVLRLSSRGPRSVDSLAREVASLASIGEELARAHLARLIKYGLLTQHSQPSLEAERADRVEEADEVCSSN